MLFPNGMLKFLRRFVHHLFELIYPDSVVQCCRHGQKSKWSELRHLFIVLGTGILTFSDSDIFLFQKILTFSDSEVSRFWSILTFSALTFYGFEGFCHFLIPTSSDSDVFRFWHFQDLEKNGFWRFQILTCSALPKQPKSLLKFLYFGALCAITRPKNDRVSWRKIAKKWKVKARLGKN